MIRVLLIALCFMVFCGTAYAQVQCGSDSHYTVSSADLCFLILDGISDAGNETSATIALPKNAINDYECAVVAIEKAQASCEPGTITCSESNSAVAGAPNVWAEYATLTGVVSPLIASVTRPRGPKRNLRCTLAAITDADCTDVDVSITFKKKCE